MCIWRTGRIHPRSRVAAGGNPELKVDACIVRSDPYEQGWLYSVRGEPEAESMDVNGYIELLGGTIQRMAEEGHGEEGAEEA
jgi:glycine cleavage system H protein